MAVFLGMFVQLLVHFLFRNALILALKEQERLATRQPIIKTGISCHLLLEMDDRTFKRHLRLTRQQFDVLNEKLGELGMSETGMEKGGRKRIPLEHKTLMFLWYMANTNSFREIGDKFNVCEAAAHCTINTALEKVCEISPQYICWPDDGEKMNSVGVFNRKCRQNGVIGAIDGCHIRIQRPPERGIDYINRKTYYSVLLQGICNDEGRFIDIFTGIPGRVHDCRMLRCSDFFAHWQEKMGEYKLLGDSAYDCQDFPFIIATKRGNNLSNDDIAKRELISKGRVIIENTFGRLKCRFRRLRDVQNVKLLIIVRVIIAACTLHNMCMDLDFCDEHACNCPRLNDDNND